jgi:hypothetical protein
MDGPGFEARQEQGIFFSKTVQSGFTAHSLSHSVGNGVLPGQ